MNLNKILNKLMYKDVATVYRAEITKVGNTDDYTEKFNLIYERMPCKLAVYHERPTFHKDDVSAKMTLNYMLYYSPEYEILENDLIEVRDKKFFAGTAFYFPSHTELQLKRRREGNQE